MQRCSGREGGPLAIRQSALHRHHISHSPLSLAPPARPCLLPRPHARARLQPFRNMCEVAPKLVAAITCTRIEINAVDS